MNVRKTIFSLVGLLLLFSLVSPGMTSAHSSNDTSKPSNAKKPSSSDDKPVKNPIKYADPLIGTHSGDKGRVAPMAGAPFGMTSWTPATRSPAERCTSPYYYDDQKIQGIRGSHWASGSCTQEYGSMTVMPMTGDLKVDPEKRASTYSHDKESSTPGYYSVQLDDYDVQAEATGTKRSGFLQFTFPETDHSYIVVDSDAGYEHSTNDTKGDGYVKVLPEKNEIVGYNPVHRMYSGKGDLAGFSGYFVVQFKKPFKKYGTWNDEDEPKWDSKEADDQPGAFINFDTKKDEVVEAKIGTSFVSIEDARENLKSEIPEWDFTEVRHQAEQNWDKAFGKVKVSGGSEDQKTNFYTALYHSMLLPRLYSDVDGSYPGFSNDSKTHVATDGDYYMDFSLWDTFRAQFPLLGITQPTRAQDMVQSLVSMAKQSDWLPSFPMWSNYTTEMNDDHAISVISDAYAKGLTNFDAETAYHYMKKNATQLPDDDADYKDGKGRRGLDSYKKYGYIPLDDPVKEAYHAGQQVSRTLEYSYDDFTLAQFAKELGKEKDYNRFIKRAYNYKNVFDPSVGFMRGRNADGTWTKSFDPLKGQSYITQSSPWIYSWFAPQDVRGLANLMGGREAALERLRTTFEESAKDNFSNLYYDHGNEPGHQMPYLFDHLGAPWLTQKWVREIMKDKYHPAPDGLAGDDDAGQMSAWYVFSAMGFYPVTPGTPNYEMGSPIFDKITIQMDSGREFTIEAKNNSDQNRYIQSAKMNGEEWDKPWFTHDQMQNGGKLVLQMGSTPNKSWGSDQEAAPPSLTKQDPKLEYSDLELSTSEIDPNKPLKVKATVKNTGGLGTEEAKLDKDGTTADSKKIVLGSGESKKVTFTTKLYKGGEHQITVGDLDAKIVTVHPMPAKLDYDNFQVASEDRPEDLTAKVSVKNIGSYKTTKKIPLYVDGNKQQSKTVTLKPGESTSISFFYTFVERGTHRVRIGHSKTQSVKIQGIKPSLSFSFEGSGNTVKDASPNGLDGTLHGDGTRVAGKYGEALKLGKGDWVEVPNADLLNGGKALTVAVWVKLDDPDANQKIIGKTTTNDGYLLGVEHGKLYPEVWDTTGDSTFKEGSIPANQWAQLVLTRKAGGRLIGYVNGKEVENVSAGSQPIKDNDEPLIIGTAPWDPGKRWPMIGLIDEVRIFNQELGPEQVEQLYQNNHVTTSVADLKPLVKQYEEAGEFSNHEAAQALQLHLTAVEHFEKKGSAEKVVKHLKGFKLLLDHQRKGELISKEAYDALRTDADYLVGFFDQEK